MNCIFKCFYRIIDVSIMETFKTNCYLYSYAVRFRESANNV